MAVMTNRRLLWCMHQIVDVEGDLAEIGIFRGHTFLRLALMAQALGREACGFDSFKGMAPPGPKDVGGRGRYPEYPEGKLSCGGIDWFQAHLAKHDVSERNVSLYEGFIPDCFELYEDDPQRSGKFAFALVDVDQYEPTRIALDWVWPRLNPGGILVADDYFEECPILASAAIRAWLDTVGETERDVTGHKDTQLMIRKAVT